VPNLRAYYDVKVDTLAETILVPKAADNFASASAEGREANRYENGLAYKLTGQAACRAHGSLYVYATRQRYGRC
jgi:hypothetical protein